MVIVVETKPISELIWFMRLYLTIHHLDPVKTEFTRSQSRIEIMSRITVDNVIAILNAFRNNIPYCDVNLFI